MPRIRKIKENTDEPERVAEVRALLRKNAELYGKAYCPCALERTDATVCVCKEFIFNTEMDKCHCGLFVRK